MPGSYEPVDLHEYRRCRSRTLLFCNQSLVAVDMQASKGFFKDQRSSLASLNIRSLLLQGTNLGRIRNQDLVPREAVICQSDSLFDSRLDSHISPHHMEDAHLVHGQRVAGEDLLQGGA